MNIRYSNAARMFRVVSDDNTELLFESTRRVECEAWVLENDIHAAMLNALKELELRTRQFCDGEPITFPAALLPQVRALIARYEAMIGGGSMNETRFAGYKLSPCGIACLLVEACIIAPCQEADAALKLSFMVDQWDTDNRVASGELPTMEEVDEAVNRFITYHPDPE